MNFKTNKLSKVLFILSLICISSELFAIPSSGEINLLTPENLQLNDKWVLKDGELYPSEKPGGILWSKEKFGDFKISLEYKTSNKANSGLFFRTDPRNPVQGGFEIQIASDGLYGGKHIVGSLYDAKRAAAEAGKPDGEWNTMTLTCKEL